MVQNPKVNMVVLQYSIVGDLVSVSYTTLTQATHKRHQPKMVKKLIKDKMPIFDQNIVSKLYKYFKP
jgi:hypothetical protein